MQQAILQILMSVSGAFIALLVVIFSVRSMRRRNRYSPFTEKLLRAPGYSLGQKFDDSMTDLLMPLLTVSILPIILTPFSLRSNLATNILLLGIFLITLFGAGLFLWKHTKKVHQLKLGLDGEVYTGQELSFLMQQGAWVYHDIQGQYGNVDHIVVSTGGIFVVETKTFRKPAGKTGKRASRVHLENDKLIFPHVTTDGPIKQATYLAKRVQDYLRRHTGEEFPVIPVVALPGWFVDTDKKSQTLVINPKRGAMLQRLVRRELISAANAQLAANLIEKLARNVQSGTDKVDPDASQKYDFWLNRKKDESFEI